MNEKHYKYYVKRLKAADVITREAFHIEPDGDLYPVVLTAVFNKIAQPIENLKLLSN